MRYWVLLLSLLLSAPAARAQGVYFTSAEVLRDFFRASERVDYVRVDTRAHARAWLEQLGAAPPRESYVVYVAKTGGHIDGYAVIDEEVGQHLPITLAVALDPEGQVLRSEVLVYREPYGGQVREQRFLRQFHGKAAGDPLRLDHDVAAISGATLSSRAVIAMVRRAVALVAILRSEASVAAAPAR